MFHPLLPTFPTKLLAAMAAVMLLVTSASGARADNHISSTGAAIVGGIAGLAIGAAIADSANRNQGYNPPRYQPYPQPFPAYAQPYPAYAQPAYYPPAYRPAYARPFNPSPDVTCYPGRGLCYNDENGTIARKWTARVFGN